MSAEETAERIVSENEDMPMHCINAIAAAIRAARDEALEEAARIAEDAAARIAQMGIKRGTSCCEHMSSTAANLAAAIRERIGKVGEK